MRSIGLFLVLAGCDVTVATLEGTTDSESESESAQPLPAHHPACTDALDPSTLEPPPPSNLANPAVGGRPAFDRWRDVDCEVALEAVETCSDDDPCSDDTPCLQGTAGGTGVCSPYADADIWCDGEGEAMGFLDDQCWVCVPDEVHAAACCLDPEAFDCREWPYAADGAPGTVCKEHGDCEAGLACGSHRGAGYGICQCPGLDPETVSPPEVCW